MTVTEEQADRPWERLEGLLDQDATEAVAELLEGLGSGDVARCLDRLDQDHRGRVLELLGPERAADLIEQLPDAQGEEMLQHTRPATAAAILEELPSDEQADLITAFDPENAASILAEMEPGTARDAFELASYPADCAGGLMNKEFVAFPRHLTASEVVDNLRGRVDEIAEQAIQYMYVVDRHGRLDGVLPLRELLLAPASQPLHGIMVPEPISVPVTMPLDDLAEIFDKRPFLGLPVVAENGHLVGIVHRNKFEVAWGDRSETDSLKSRGIVGGEELRSMPVLLRARRRFSWLSVNILLNILAASVIAAYQDTLSAAIALAVFLPIISDMSGCSGNQAVAVSMRELTLGIIKPIDVFYVWRKEVAVGLINGLALGLLLAVAAWLWKGNATLGIIVGGALATNTLVAVSIGGAVPLLLKRYGMDPALASGPILTTLTDMCGFFLALSFATAALASLT